MLKRSPQGSEMDGFPGWRFAGRTMVNALLQRSLVRGILVLLHLPASSPTTNPLPCLTHSGIVLTLIQL